MNIFDSRRGVLRLVFMQATYVLIFAVLLWAMGAPTFLNVAKAANLTSVSDTLSDSAPIHNSKHVIAWTAGTTTDAGETIVLRFDPDTSAFQEVFSAATTTDITATGMTIRANSGACSGPTTDEVYVTGNYNDDLNENITLTVCGGGDSIPAGAKTVTIGASNTLLITNPANGSYRITIGGTQPDSGETRVMIISNVTLTASVDTSFTFTVTGVGSGVTINGTTTSLPSTATTLPFGTLAPSVPKTLGQRLNVATNARNGFAVTVQENEPPTSSTGATIDLFASGATTSAPTVWVAPTAVLDQQWTYGHIGLTTSDTGPGGSDDFTGSKFVGNFDQPRAIFWHTGPSNGIADNIGSTTVAYTIQISSLQEAGNDYTNTLTYVATPTF